MKNRPLFHVYRDFSKKYARATKVFNIIYEIPKGYITRKYLVKTKRDPGYKRWYQYKEVIKAFNEYLDLQEDYTDVKCKEWIQEFCLKRGYLSA